MFLSEKKENNISFFKETTIQFKIYEILMAKPAFYPLSINQTTYN